MVLPGPPAEERNAALLFSSTSVVAAITVGAMLISGWRAGTLDNSVEWVFWAGAILAAVGIGALGVASVSGGGMGLLRAGMTLFLLGPVLCVIAVFADYWI